MAENFMPEQPQMPQVDSGKPAEKKEGQQFEQVAPAKERPKQKPKPTPVQPVIPSQQAAQSLPQESQKSETLERIEDIMEEDLGEMYASLPPERKEQFRKQGEETAKEIEGMMYKVKVKSKKVFKLMFSWLKIIPGVSKYFLEQEAKLKTDELMHLKEEMDKQRSNQI